MEILNILREHVVDNYLLGADDEDLKDDTSFMDSRIIDSTGVLEVVAFLEEEFDIEVEDDELVPDNFDSLSKLAAYVARKSEA